MSEADDQYIKKLEWHIDTLIAKCNRIENENIALAQANSDLRSEVRILESQLAMVSEPGWRMER